MAELQPWRGDRVVEGNGLENRRAGNGTEGSNPSLSAMLRSRFLFLTDEKLSIFHREEQ